MQEAGGAIRRPPAFCRAEVVGQVRVADPNSAIDEVIDMADSVRQRTERQSAMG